MTDASATATPPTTGPIDWSDPCARAQALTTAFYTLLSGAQEIEIRTRTDEAEESVKFAPAKLDDLRSEMQTAIDECAAKNAGRPVEARRFAITARHKRLPCQPFPFARRFP